MRIKTIGVGYERKFNLGDFESVTLNAQLYADIREEEDEEKCLNDLYAAAKNAIIENIPPSYTKNKPSMTKKFLRAVDVDLKKSLREKVNEDWSLIEEPNFDDK